LKLRGINFVLIEKNGKKPFQKEWQKQKIEFDNPELLAHITAGGNYGVMGGGEKNLILVDFDDEKVQEQCLKLLPATFTVRTGSGMLHLYYFSNGKDSFKIFEENMDTLCDVQGEGKQVVGAGSIHPNGNKYEVIKDVPISFVDYAELKAVLMPFDKKPKKEKPKLPEAPKERTSDDDFGDLIKTKVSMDSVLNWIGIDTSRNPTQCPFHNSAGGKCLGFKSDTAHCFHCDGSWNIFSMVKEWKKCDYPQALEHLAKLGNMEKELEECRTKFKEKKAKELKQVSDKWGFAEAGSDTKADDGDSVEKIIKKKMSKMNIDKEEILEQFVQLYPLYYDNAKVWWQFDLKNLRWVVTDETDVLNIVREQTPLDTYNATEKNEILETLRQISRKNKPKEIEPTWIQLKNKFVDVRTGKETPVTSEWFATNPIPWEMHPEKFMNTPIMDRIFTEWVGKEHIQILYEIIAYCLLPDYPIHRLFCFLGAGMNGKSCFLKLIEKLVGMDNVCSTELDTLMASRFEVTRLHKKLVCIMGETNFNELKQTSIIKKITGEDLIGFEYKNKNPFQDRSYAKILIATNNLPETTDKTVGFYRRWCIVDFPNQFSEVKDVLAEIPDEEYQSLALKSIGILHDLLKHRKFTKEGSLEERKKRFEEKSNPIEKFIKDYIRESLGEADYVTKSSFCRRYNEWAHNNHHREMSDETIGRIMHKKGVLSGQRRLGFKDANGQDVRGRTWEGLKWVDDLA